METKNATVTLPYEEFEEMRRNLERIKAAEEFEDKVTSGDFVPKSELKDLEVKLFVMGAIAIEQYSGLSSTKFPANPHQMATKYGFSLEIIELHGKSAFELKNKVAQ